MGEFAGSGDARRSMALLWGRCEVPTRGPKQGLTHDAIVRAAIDLADEEGLGAVSMRKVGERLGTSAMALYTYVPAKTELLDMMLDTVRRDLVVPTVVDGRWRDAVAGWVAAEWDFARRHAWVAQISTARPLLGPGELDLYESQLRIFDGLPLEPAEIARVAASIAYLVDGAIRQVADARAAEQAMGTPEDEWWYERSALLEEMTSEIDWVARWPTMSRLQDGHAFDQTDRDPDDATPYLERDARDAFEFGLARLLDGVEALIAARAGH